MRGKITGRGGTLGQRLLKVEVPLQEAPPGCNVNVHLVGPGDFALLAEDFLLPPQFRPSGDQGIKEFNLQQKQSRSLGPSWVDNGYAIEVHC